MLKATCVELSVMGKDKAVALLLNVANIEKATYLAGVAYRGGLATESCVRDC
jgi:hypothetical protein